jgi:hypothetical protein
MTDQENIHRIIEQAKQQRAELIGTSVRKHPLIALLLVSIPVLLTQVPWSPSSPIAAGIDSNTSPTLERRAVAGYPGRDGEEDEEERTGDRSTRERTLSLGVLWPGLAS